MSGRGHGVEAAYFSQHEAELDERGSVLDAAMSGTGLKRPEAQKLLGRFLFSGWDEHEKPVAALSGGERRRLALAIVVASGANLLVLDEPTNHLDLESRESLEAALEAFPGTILLVSHDRALLDAVASRLLAVEDGRLASYPGGWADYARAQEADAAPPPPPPQPKRERPKRPPKPKASPIELVEAEVARAEARVAELERKLADDWHDVGPGRGAPRRARRPRRRCSAAGKRCSKRADRRLGDRVEDEDRLVRPGLSEGGELGGQVCGVDRRRLGAERPLSAPPSTATSRQALRRTSFGSRPARSQASSIVELSAPKPAARFPNCVVPGVPPRRRAAASRRAGAARCRRPSARASVPSGGSSRASSSRVELPVERDAVAVEEAPDDRSNASSNRETRRSNGSPKARNSASFQPDAEGDAKTPAAHLVDGRRGAGEHCGRPERGARDERAELDAARWRRRSPPAPTSSPTARARASRHRGRGDGRRPRPSRTPSPRRRPPALAAPASARRARPPGAGPRPSRPERLEGRRIAGDRGDVLPDAVAVVDQQHLVDVELAARAGGRARDRRRRRGRRRRAPSEARSDTCLR